MTTSEYEHDIISYTIRITGETVQDRRRAYANDTAERRVNVRDSTECY